MTPLSDAIEILGWANVWTFLALFLAASLIMIWRLEALLDHGLEGTALGTLVMPYCSGFANLVFVAIVFSRGNAGQEVLTNCLVNNTTNLTLILGLCALGWGLPLSLRKKSGPYGGGKKAAAARETEHRLNRLSLLLTLTAALFFSAATWVLGTDGRLDWRDGAVLVGLFLFWQCLQVFDVLKHNVRSRRSFSPLFYLDLLFVLLGAYGLYESIDWLVTWVSRQEGGFINPANLGWLSGWLMVLPNALLAFFYAARGRADITLASQVGDGHICIPLCLGLSALLQPIAIPPIFGTGVAIVAGAAFAHLVFVLIGTGLPRWMGWVLVGGYVWFLAAGFA